MKPPVVLFVLAAATLALMVSSYISWHINSTRVVPKEPPRWQKLPQEPKDVGTAGGQGAPAGLAAGVAVPKTQPIGDENGEDLPDVPPGLKGSGVPPAPSKIRPSLPARPADAPAVPPPSEIVVVTLPARPGKEWLGPVGPDPALGPVTISAGPHKGQPCVNCPVLAITTCCTSWGFTEIFLSQLLTVDDDIHIVIFDDISKDGGAENALAMGFTVIQPKENAGLTALMNMAWRYFYARPELSLLMLMNNDLEISRFGTIAKLARCMSHVKVR